MIQKIRELLLARQALVACGLLVLVALVLFIYSVEKREQWFGVYSGEYHDWLTATTVLVASDWRDEGALKTRFAMFENPASPEFASFRDRLPYVSYPPGAVIPVYLVSYLTGDAPSVGMVMGYNLANHLLITIFLALTAFFFLRSLKMSVWLAFLFALAPILLELFLPYPFYFQQNVFFAQQAVLLPFSVAVFLEVLRGNAPERRRGTIDVILGLVFLYGIFTEWLFVFVAAVFYVKRLLTGEIGIRPGAAFLSGSLRLLAWPLAGLALFFAYLMAAMWEERGWALSTVLAKFFARSGAESGAGASRLDNLRNTRAHIVEGFGPHGKLLIYASVIFIVAAIAYLAYARLAKKTAPVEISRSAQLAAIIFIPSALHLLVFQQHAANHSFAVLQLAFSIAIIPFVLMPLCLAVVVRGALWRGADLGRIMALFLLPVLMTAGAYVAVTHGNHKAFFGPKNEYWYQVADAASRNIGPHDIVFSPDMEVPLHPPHRLSLSMKRVHLVGTSGAAKEVFEIATGFYRTLLTFWADRPGADGWRQEVAAAGRSLRGGFDSEAIEEMRDILEDASGDYRVVILFWEEPPAGSSWRRAVDAADASVEDGAFYVFFDRESFARLLGSEAP